MKNTLVYLLIYYLCNYTTNSNLYNIINIYCIQEPGKQIDSIKVVFDLDKLQHDVNVSNFLTNILNTQKYPIEIVIYIIYIYFQ